MLKPRGSIIGGGDVAPRGLGQHCGSVSFLIDPEEADEATFIEANPIHLGTNSEAGLYG